MIDQGSAHFEGRCAAHPSSHAVATCNRCGDFACDACRVHVDEGRVVCAACSKLPGVDYLGGLRGALWGKRDGFVWLIGGLWSLGGGLELLMFGFALLVEPSLRVLLGALLALTGLAVTISYFLRRRFARLAVFAIPVVGLLQIPTGPEEEISARIGGAVFALAVAVAAYFSASNKLAFEIDIPHEQLKKLYMWRAHKLNKAAANALMWGVVALFVPLVEFIVVYLAIRGLRAVDARACPPIGGRLYAVCALALVPFGLLSTAASVKLALF